MLLKDLAAALDAPFEGDPSLDLRRVAALEDATATDLSFVGKGRAARGASDSQAGCLLVPSDYDNAAARPVIRTRDPRGAAARAIRLLHPTPTRTPGIHPTAVIDPSATIGQDAAIGPHVTIGANCRIGDHVTIEAGCAIGPDCTIGANSLLHPRATLYSEVTLGERNVIHSGAVLGADGFGFVFTNGAYEKFPQIGRVELGNDVEIGANACIDRAALGVTSIGDGTKLDNMVHIAHNCRIGRNVVIAAQTGISGGVIVEDYAVIGGQVGIGDKAVIQSKAVLGSGSGVLTSKIVKGGQVMWGTPARPLKEYLESLATLSKLSKKRKTQE
jgi:UDP-3-O-[3-hydroxymyristoyl] glucosamine N-acyltransferase